MILWKCISKTLRRAPLLLRHDYTSYTLARDSKDYNLTDDDRYAAMTAPYHIRCPAHLSHVSSQLSQQKKGGCRLSPPYPTALAMRRMMDSVPLNDAGTGAWALRRAKVVGAQGGRRDRPQPAGPAAVRGAEAPAGRDILLRSGQLSTGRRHWRREPARPHGAAALLPPCCRS